MSDDTDAWIALSSAEGVGPSVFGRLVDAFGSARAVLRSVRRGDVAEMLREHERSKRAGEQRGLPPDLGAAVSRAADRAEELVSEVRALGVEVVTLRDEAYPARLHGLDDAPPVLFLRGSVGALTTRASVAVVGTRRPTPAGRALAGAVGSAIATTGAAVVSGLAFGIDAAAHAGAVHASGRTVAVLGSGLGVITPAAHRHLARAIVGAGGAIVSEMLPTVRPTKGTYPRRNRIIAALADAVVVVEAPARSGALNTANWAATLGRDLYVAPGRPGERTTAGCLALLHDVPGSRPLVDVPTLIDDLGLVDEREPSSRVRPALRAVLVDLSPTEAALARRLRDGPAGPDRLAAACGLPVGEVVSALGLLELRGYAWSSGPLYVAGGALRDAR